MRHRLFNPQIHAPATVDILIEIIDQLRYLSRQLAQRETNGQSTRMHARRIAAFEALLARFDAGDVAYAHDVVNEMADHHEAMRRLKEERFEPAAQE